MVIVTCVDGRRIDNSKYLVDPEVETNSEYTIRTNEERSLWRRKIKKSHANEIEFKRIKQAKKKAVRKLKKSKRQ